MPESVLVTHSPIQHTFGKVFRAKLNFPQVNIVHLLCERIYAKVAVSMTAGNLEEDKINPKTMTYALSLPAIRLLEYPIQKHFHLFTLVCVAVHTLPINQLMCRVDAAIFVPEHLKRLRLDPPAASIVVAHFGKMRRNECYW